jgi:AhpD family alkylhydroperoxidase
MSLKQQRLFNFAEFYRVLDDAFASAGDFVAAQKKTGISKQFQERIMLAVTQVNGCRYCNYFHTAVALRQGMSEAEIKQLIAGEFGDVPEDEVVALFFAQHYAETMGDYDAEAYARLETTYGKDHARQILAAIRAIMVGNAHGIMFDALQFRLRGRAFPDSSLGNEVGVVFGIAGLMPVIGVKRLIRRFF